MKKAYEYKEKDYKMERPYKMEKRKTLKSQSLNGSRINNFEEYFQKVVN